MGSAPTIVHPPPLIPIGTDGRDLAQRAYWEIRAAIASMSFQPGQQLQESFLAQWLGISRTPVREAIRRLQSEGLIEILPTRRVIVAQFSIAEIENAYLVIEVMEGLASRLGAERRSKTDADTLLGLIRSMSEAAKSGDTDTWTKLDAQLHDVIRGIASNSKLSQTANIVYPVIERVRNIFLREGTEPDRLVSATIDHSAMVDAIVAGDGPGAEKRTRHLFAKARLDNVRLLQHWVVPLRRSF